MIIIITLLAVTAYRLDAPEIICRYNRIDRNRLQCQNNSRQQPSQQTNDSSSNSQTYTQPSLNQNNMFSNYRGRGGFRGGFRGGYRGRGGYNLGTNYSSGTDYRVNRLHVSNEGDEDDGSSTSTRPERVMIRVLGNTEEYPVILDTGSPISIVHPRVLEAMRVPYRIRPPSDGRQIVMANPQFRQEAIGTVELLVDVVYRNQPHKPPMMIRHEFEVMATNEPVRNGY